MADNLSNEFKGISAVGGPLLPFSANVVPGVRIFSAHVVPKNRFNRFLRIMLSGRYNYPQSAPNANIQKSSIACEEEGRVRVTC